jgi:hypothetical protein
MKKVFFAAIQFAALAIAATAPIVAQDNDYFTNWPQAYLAARGGQEPGRAFCHQPASVHEDNPLFRGRYLVWRIDFRAAHA